MKREWFHIDMEPISVSGVDLGLFLVGGAKMVWWAERRAAHLHELDEISATVADAKSQLRKSIWDAYTEIFETVRGKSTGQK